MELSDVKNACTLRDVIHLLDPLSDQTHIFSLTFSCTSLPIVRI